MIWATGWEDRANDYLLQIARAAAAAGRSASAAPPASAARTGSSGRSRSSRPAGRLAWIDDSLDESCHEWARNRPEPTLLVPTLSAKGLEDSHVETLIEWAVGGDAAAG